MSRALRVVLIAAVGVVLAAGCGPAVPGEQVRSVDERPRIWPDYRGVTIPPNIAPLRFRVEEPGGAFFLRISSEGTEPVDVASHTPVIAVPVEPWHRLLAESAGRAITYSVSVRSAGGDWRRFAGFSNAVAAEPIDPYLIYRMIRSVFVGYGHMTIRQRKVTSFAEDIVMDTARMAGGCVNCHAVCGPVPGVLSMQLRSEEYGTGMVMTQGGTTRKIDTKTSRSIGPAAYTSWHPSGRAVAYSMNQVMQFFHTARREVRDVADRASDIALYLPESGRVVSTGAITDPEYLETYPAWSADGRYLYFSRGLRPWPEGRHIPPPRFDELQYDLARIAYDIDTGEWGEVETVLSARETGLSMTQPRPSPDGRYLLFCATSYGCFPIYHEDADICLLDMEAGEWRRLDLNSERQDTWRSWSSNGRWIVFSSKRDNGVVARPYIAYFAPDGTFSKPFVLPQADPGLYEGYLLTYNVPELSPNPVPAGLGELLAAARSTAAVAAGVPATAASPRPGEDGEGRTTPWAPTLGQ